MIRRSLRGSSTTPDSRWWASSRGRRQERHMTHSRRPRPRTGGMSTSWLQTPHSPRSTRCQSFPPSSFSATLRNRGSTTLASLRRRPSVKPLRPRACALSLSSPRRTERRFSPMSWSRCFSSGRIARSTLRMIFSSSPRSSRGSTCSRASPGARTRSCGRTLGHRTMARHPSCFCFIPSRASSTSCKSPLPTRMPSSSFRTTRRAK
mmetsp:Transcript_8360/g.21657  ORF Transcript_8360/g.21657 Transcript_8360/m.21657 type:complete len:206 (+) Transcript_8360:646-1263(+)